MQIGQKIEYWKNRLLDLSKRNRLINCALPKSGVRAPRVALLISQPSSDELWNTFMDEDYFLQFPIPIDSNECTADQETVLPFNKFSNGIQTNQSPVEAYKTLRSLMKKSKEFSEEKGLNALHLAFGFLNWKENSEGGQEMRSPLLLIPVTLSQESLNDPILLSRSGDEISVNSTLEQKLFNDFGITLPVFDEQDDWQTYLSQVSEVCSSLNWYIETEHVQLSMFSFLKVNMYKDLERNIDKITGHHIVRLLNGEVFENNSTFLDINNINHDITDPQNVFSVLDSDSSQQDAILSAKRGISFVLQGPPGTGKSQTITNIIAELISEGKKVLFVSEKMAALEVVHKRLIQTGLDAFCLTLHSHKAKRSDLLEQLKLSISISKQKAELHQEAFNKLYRLKEMRSTLNLYAQELHNRVEPLGITIFQVNGLIANYGNYKNIDYIQDAADSFTSELLDQCVASLEELVRIVEKSGYQNDNPWNGCVIDNVTYEFRQQFLVDATKTISLIENGIQHYNKIIQLTGAANMLVNVAEIGKINCLLEIAKKSPSIPFKWLNIDINAQIENIQKCVIAVKRNEELHNFYDNLKLHTDILTKSISHIAESFTIMSDNNWQVMNAEYASASDNFMALLSMNDISLQLPTFRLLFENHQELFVKCKIADKEHVEVSENFSMAIQSLEDTQIELLKCDGAWKEIQASILDNFDMSVLSIDLNDILRRYRSQYRSWFNRFFSGLYKKDKQALLSHCKKYKKMSYEETLLELDELCNAQKIFENYNKQIVLVEYAKKFKNDKELLLSECISNLSTISELCSTSKAECEIFAQNLVAELAIFLHNQEEQVEKENQLLSELLNSTSTNLSIDITVKSDFAHISDNLSWALMFQRLYKKYALGIEFSRKICIREERILQDFSDLVNNLSVWLETFEPWLEKFADLFDDTHKEDFDDTLFIELKQHIKNCHDNLASLEYLIDYRNAERRLTSLGINNYLVKAKELNLAASEIIPIFKKCFYRSWLDLVIPKYPSVYNFRRERQDANIENFKDYDKSHMEISKAALLAKLIARLPNFDSCIANNGEIALLRREITKKRKLMPTRKLIATIPNLLTTLKPCMMMSPLSVSTYLGSSDYEFDTVIFDEASQIRTEDAICSIFRAKQAIIVGDSKQLPPTDFFISSLSDNSEVDEDEEGNINDAGAYESLLDEASMMPTQTLLWHYRSKHEHLIAFSNAQIYQGNLITFPSSVEKSDNIGVEYIHVPDGIYERGSSRGNQREGERIAELVFEHFQQSPNRSLGVIAFSEAQQSIIEEAIIRKRRENQQYEEFFINKDETLFIKNLETVQGDERDTIIFSIGYAADSSGKFIMNFGPLSRAGGERRLNVAVTRARYNVKLVGSILPTDINVDGVVAQGPKLLRLYIDFAINGAQSIFGEITTNVDSLFDSSFEETVYNFLTANGYDVVSKVGCSSYRIDMAIRHPKYNGRYAIGIECDGSAYRSARIARERDRLRQTVLENMGWKLYRIWSTDWIKDQQTEGSRLLMAVKHVIENYQEEQIIRLEITPQANDFLDLTEKSTDEIAKDKYNKIRSSYAGCKANEIPVSDFEETMIRVLENNFGLDKVSLFKETAQYGYLWQRQGAAIKEKFESTYKYLLTQEKIAIEGRKIRLIGL